MQEIGLFLLIVIGLVGLGLAQVLPALLLIERGQELMLSAAAVGMPLQLLYFGLLGTALSVSGLRPVGWYWRPFAHHHLLTPTQRRVVLPVFYAASLCFLVILLGIGITCLGLAGLALGG